MIIIIAITSIPVITGFVWFANKIFSFNICPICAGVAGTWLWILAEMYVGSLKAENWQLAAAMLMGGTVVGVAYRIEKKLPPFRSQLLWKTIFIPFGFAAAYNVLLRQWGMTFVFLALLSLFSFILLSSRQNNKTSNEAVEQLKEKMKDCC